MLKVTRATDPVLAELVNEELKRQEHNIEMIASESTAPLAVMELTGSVFTNKTLEGYPGKRFQAGSHIADKVEELACQRARELFGADHANIQSYSGSTANYSVYASILNPGDKVLSMRLDQGGHLTHGSPANWVSKIYHFEFYAMDPETELIDYDALDAKAKEYRPKLIVAGASSYSRLIDYERIAKTAKEVGAYFMVDMAHIAGLVAAKVIPSPIPYADFVTSSTTKTFCSARSGMVFCKAEHAKLLDKGTFPGALGSIQLHTMAAKCWSFKYAASDEFRAIMEQVVKNAKCLAEELKKYGFRIVSGGTDNHLLVADLRGKNITGKLFQDALDSVGITVNKNMIPFDPEKPSVTSGVRIGLTAVTQRGLKEPEIREIAAIMNKVADAPEDEKNLAECRAQAEALISRFPLYPAGSFDD
ncbi:MAG TPA: serine hydroxymethyltransferase [Candidatus Blautia stercorigallinarum]|uniref:2-methylserine hydroxymethyltransferase n=1 Tax=Candidatus Blautia stercorigallinarum TaxID=2838501 RepID=A0A9D1PAS6_9FIRM|nr:serine hydroxymethyltransferase [Candidatus Blautia stercorigallinarum]